MTACALLWCLTPRPSCLNPDALLPSHTLVQRMLKGLIRNINAGNAAAYVFTLQCLLPLHCLRRATLMRSSP